MALACSWGSFADTDISFSEFFGNNHTIVLRFMPQYPHAYTGPLVAVRGEGRFLIAQGDFLFGQPSDQTKLVVDIGKNSLVVPVALPPAHWIHLAVVRKAGKLTIYVNGSAATDQMDIPQSNLPVGTVRIGKDQLDSGAQPGAGQFYGFVDDVAIFTTALSAQEIEELAASAHLTGSENDLLAGFTFGYVPNGGVTPELSRPVEVSPTAGLTAVSEDRNSFEDAKKLPLGHTSPMELPFEVDQAWYVIQGFDDPKGSHRGYASFCWDFRLAGLAQSESKGEPFYACAPGVVDHVLEESVSGTANISNFISVKQAEQEFCDYVHLVQKSATAKIGDLVAQSEHLGDVGDTGASVGAFHLHLAVTNLGEGNKKLGGSFLTIPSAFANYEASDDEGQTWYAVPLGIPRQGQWIRRTAPPDKPGLSLKGLGREWVAVATILFGVIQDAGGVVVIGGRPVPVGPWDPLRDLTAPERDILLALGIRQLAHSISDPDARKELGRACSSLIERSARHLR